MKTIHFISVALSLALAFPAISSAQDDEREPGIYAIVGEESIPLIYSNGTTSVTTTNVVGFEIGKRKFTYKEASSGVNASKTFVMVIDKSKKGIVRTMKSYNPFIKSMTPDNVLILPLAVARNKRLYEEGRTFAGINFTIKDRVDFEWEQITDNSYEIRIPQLIPGEYGFIFRPAKLGEFDYSAIFGFTYSE